jgi:hypothetical protein
MTWPREVRCKRTREASLPQRVLSTQSGQRVQHRQGPPLRQYATSCSIEAEKIQSQSVIVDIQMIGRKPHASTGLDSWIGFKNKAIRERSDLPNQSSLPSI